MDASTGKLTISFIEPVLSGGQLQAVVGADVHLDSVVNKVKSIQPTAQSFAFLLDGQSNILAHANQALLLKPAQQLDPALNAQQLARLAQSQGHTVVPVGGTDYFLYAAKVQGTPWSWWWRQSVPMLGLVRACSICTSIPLLTPDRVASWSSDQSRSLRRSRALRAMAAATSSGSGIR